MIHAIHLVRRAVGSIRNSPPSDRDNAWTQEILLPGEYALWATLDARDQVHSIQVLKRFVELQPRSPREDLAAALLHDVGKSASGLGWLARVIATLVGPRGRRFTMYHEHELVGLRMLEGISAEPTLKILRGEGPSDVVDALRRADNLE